MWKGCDHLHDVRGESALCYISVNRNVNGDVGMQTKYQRKIPAVILNEGLCPPVVFVFILKDLLLKANV